MISPADSVSKPKNKRTLPGVISLLDDSDDEGAVAVSQTSPAAAAGVASTVLSPSSGGFTFRVAIYAQAVPPDLVLAVTAQLPGTDVDTQGLPSSVCELLPSGANIVCSHARVGRLLLVVAKGDAYIDWLRSACVESLLAEQRKPSALAVTGEGGHVLTVICKRLAALKRTFKAHFGFGGRFVWLISDLAAGISKADRQRSDETKRQEKLEASATVDDEEVIAVGAGNKKARKTRLTEETRQQHRVNLDRRAVDNLHCHALPLFGLEVLHTVG
jgi:hypothetical protein